MIVEQQAASIENILRRDVGWAAYALADLQPAFAPFCRWLIGDSDSGAGLVLLYDGLETPALVSVGAAGAVQAALASAQLPDTVYLNVPYDHLPVIDRWYDGSGDRRPMVRMVYSGELDAFSVNGQEPVRLGLEDAPRIRGLYRHGGPFTPDAFAPYQLENGLFYGLAGKEDELLAVGGTHIVDWTRGVAAIGNMYTQPALRGRGYASVILKTLVRNLQARQVNTIVLNVDERNASARRLYERHGFHVHCPYVEGTARRI